MSEKREVIIHARESLHGPHGEPPTDFVPLKLRHAAEHVTILVTCPVALVGRSSRADVRLAYSEVSRQHCRFSFDNGQWRVCDLKSLNGVYVNNVLQVEATLYAGDVLRIGNVTLLVLSATPVKLTTAEEAHHEKLRQIADVLPRD